MERNVDVLRTLKTINSKLIEPIQVSFGPSGLGIMLANDFSTVITRRGLDILEYLEPSHPLHGWILKSAQNLGREVGDGVKTFLLYLESFIDQVKPMNRLEFIVQLKKLTVCLDKLTADLPSSYDDVTVNFVSNFFTTRLPCHVSQTVAQLIFQWIQTSQSFDFLLTHFDCLVNVNTEGCTSVTDNLVVPGRYIGRMTPSWKPVVLVVFHCSKDTMTLERKLDGIKESESYLIVTNSEVPSKDLISLNRRSIDLIHLVPEYFSFFLHEIQCLEYAKGGSDLLAEFSTGSNLINPLLKLRIGVHRLNLSAPTKQLVKNYNQNIRDCLTMIRFSSGSPCIQSGQFDHQLASILSETTVVEPSRALSKKQLEWMTFNSPSISPLTGISTLLNQFNFETDFISVVTRTLMSVSGRLLLEENESSGCESLRVRLVVLSRALSSIAQFLRIDCILPRKKMSHSDFA